MAEPQNATAIIEKLGYLPALAPPPGVIPHHEFSQEFHVLNIAVTCVVVIITTITVALRLATKLFISKDHGWEDYFMYLGWACTMAYLAIGVKTAQSGGGTHQWNVSVEDIVHFAYWATICELLYEPAIFFSKLAIILQIQRLFIVTKNSRFYLTWAIIWLNAIFYIANFLIVCFQLGVFGVLSDFLIFMLPVVWIWKIKMSNMRRLGVSMIFGVACIGCVASILRLYYSIANYNTTDSTFGLQQIGMACAGEFFAAILVGNMVLMPRFFSFGWERLSSTINSRRSKSGTSGHSTNFSKYSSQRKIRRWSRERDEESLSKGSVELTTRYAEP